MVLRQSLPPSARDYARAQRRESQAAIAAILSEWDRMGPEFDLSWSRIEPNVMAIVMQAQRRMSTGALGFIPDVLEDTGQSAEIAAAGLAQARPLIGVAGDGRPADSLLYGAVTRSKEVIGSGGSVRDALGSSAGWIESTVATLLSDTARQSEALGMGVRPVTGYVRMLTPPSCSRCVLLAGKRVKSGTAFLRHPGCDCRHIPASESVAGDMTVSPADYFESLNPAQQDKTFGKAGAEAIRSGADIGQVVNARRGMQAAQVGGRKVLLTSEGTTRRGLAYRQLSPSRASDTRLPGQRYASAKRPRAMPETIAQIATDKDDYLRLLRVNGYLI